MTTQTLKRKQQNKKPGRVVRLPVDIEAIIEAEKYPYETIGEFMRRKFGVKAKVRYVLPGDLKDSIEDARGEAIIRQVRMKLKRAEKPIAVREIGE